MHVAVVVPCLNEEATLSATCASLGFGAEGRLPADTSIILVDNGSTDGSCTIMEHVRALFPSAVHVVQELERGYVPPRHRGALEAQALATARAIPESEILLVQADADTLYFNGYVDAMRNASRRAGPGVMIEAIMEPPAEFCDEHAGYVMLSKAVDESVAHLFVDDVDQIVVDDKAVAIRLSDYFSWGGHRREFGLEGDEIHAETTRLLINGLAKGARTYRADKAVATSSRRKVIGDPALFFATAGFPREASWNAKWRERYRGPSAIEAFEGSVSRGDIAEAVLTRQMHSVILFGVLPMLVADLAGRSIPLSLDAKVLAELCDLVPAAELRLDRPGMLVSNALMLMDIYPHVLRRVIENELRSE